MKCIFSVNDVVKICYRDETVVGIVSAVRENDFVVKLNNNRNIILPNDVGNYVTKVEDE